MKGDSNPFSETGIWNVAAEFSTDVLMKHIQGIDTCLTVAEMGAGDINQNISLSENDLKENRILGLVWFHKHLSQLISNTKFAVKKNKDNETLEELHQSLEDIKKYLDATSYRKINQATNQSYLEINEKLFKYVFNMILEIKEKVYPILHKNDILYRYVEQYDPKAMKKAYMDSMSGVID